MEKNRSEPIKKALFFVKHWKATLIISLVIFIFIFIVGFVSIIVMLIANEDAANDTEYSYEMSTNYILYYDIIIEELELQGVDTEFSAIILAMIEVLTGGEGNDVMSVNIYVSGSNVTEPLTSISVGTSRFAELLVDVGLDPTIYNEDDLADIMVAIQAYVFGDNYTDYMTDKEYRTAINEVYASENDITGTIIYFADDVMFLKTNLIDSLGFYLIWPLPSSFGTSWISRGFTSEHNGIDIAAYEGTPIYASAAGYVVSAEHHWSWGNNVLIEHNEIYKTRYAHMTDFVVSAGDYVQAGDLIGYVGNTGNSTGNHLHFEVYEDGTRVDPWQWLQYVAPD